MTFGVGLGVDCSQGLWIALHARADFLNLKIETQLESPPRTLWLGVLLETCTACWFPGDGVARRFCKMPLVVGAGPGAEWSGPGCGMGELRGSRIPVCGVSTSFRYTLWVAASRLRKQECEIASIVRVAAKPTHTRIHCGGSLRAATPRIGRAESKRRTTVKRKYHVVNSSSKGAARTIQNARPTAKCCCRWWT